MGVALADAASEYGGDVDLVLGPVNIRPENKSIRITNVTTAESMAAACISRFSACDIAILAAAVADFTPVMPADKKMKRGNEDLILKLKPTKDIAKILGMSKKKSQIVAGFALETDNELEKAKAKLEGKNLDLIILNSLKDKGAGFEYDTNRITIIDRNNIIDKFELKTKEEAARDILDKIITMVNSLPE